MCTTKAAASSAETYDEKAEAPAAHFDDMFELIGYFGRYQVFIVIATQLAYLFIASVILSTAFIGIQYDGRQLNNSTCKNLTRDNVAFYSLPMELGFDCSSWNVSTFLALALMIGGVVGSFIAGRLADRFGRKPVAIGGLGMSITATFILAVAGHIAMALAALFFAGFFTGAYMVVCMMWMVEQVGPQYRLLAVTLNGFSAGVMYMAGVAYLTQHWRWYILAVACTGVPFLIASFFIPESPRWLIQQRRFTEAHAVLQKITAINKRNFYAVNLDNLVPSIQQNLGYMEFLRNKRILVLLLAVCYSYFVAALVSTSVYYQLGSLSGNMFLNMFLAGLFNSCTAFVPVILNRWVGRRPLLCMLVGIVAFCCWFIVVVSLVDGGHRSIAITIAAVVSASAIDPIFKLNDLCSNELFPTVVRGKARGSVSVARGLGNLVGPQIILNLVPVHFPSTYIIYGILATAHLLVCWFVIPETKHIVMPDRMDDKVQYRNRVPVKIACLSASDLSTCSSRAKIVG